MGRSRGEEEGLEGKFSSGAWAKRLKEPGRAEGVWAQAPCSSSLSSLQSLLALGFFSVAV